MKKYIVKWKNEEKDFTDVQEAAKFAEETGVNAYVWVEMDGVRDREPFFKCEWSI